MNQVLGRACFNKWVGMRTLLADLARLPLLGQGLGVPSGGCECIHQISGRAGFHKWVSMRALLADLARLPLLGQGSGSAFCGVRVHT